VLRLLLLSVLVATFLVPVVTARARDPRRAFLALLTYVVTAEVGYALFLYFIYLRFIWS
jgi:hypothetical protein